MSITILVRVFIETSKMEVGKQAAVMIINKLQSSVGVSQQQIKQYWKIPEYLEISLEFIPKIGLNEAFQAVVDQLGDGWNFSSPSTEKWAVWNPAEGNFFFIPEVRWSCVEIIP